MTEDATLSAFAADEADSDASERDSSADDAADAGGDDSSADDGTATTGRETAQSDESPFDVDPATSTYVWGTYTCDECSETVDRAWLENDTLVCPACKNW